MSTKTRTTTTHYHIQKKRRARPAPGACPATTRTRAVSGASPPRRRSAAPAASTRPTTSRTSSRPPPRHAHQIPERPRHRQRGVGAFASDDPVRPGQDAIAAPPSGRSLALCGRGIRPQLHGHRAGPGPAPPLEEGRPHHRRPFPLAPALQRRSEERVPARVHPHVRLDPRDDARVDGSDGALRGGRGHAPFHPGTLADRVARGPAAGALVDQARGPRLRGQD